MRILALLGLTIGVSATALAAPAAPVVPVLQAGHPWDGSEPQFAVSPDGKWVISSSSTLLKLWNSKGELVRDLEMPKFVAETPIWGRDNRKFFLTGQLGTAVYEMPAGRKRGEFRGAQLSEDGRFFVRRGEKTLRFSDAQTGKRLATVRAEPAGPWPETLSFSPDGKRVAMGQTTYAGSNGQMPIWNLESGKLEHTLSDPRGGFGKSNGVIGPALWSSDGKILVTGGEDPDWQIPADDGGPQTESFFSHAYAVKVWESATGKLLRVWPGFGSNQSGVPLREFVAPDEVSLSDSNNTILNLVTGKTRQSSTPISMGRQIVYLNNRTGYFELRAPGGKTLQGFPIRGFAGFEKMAYSPDGTLLAAAASNDNSVKIYNAHSGALKKVLPMKSSIGNESVVSLKWLTNGNLSASSLQSAWIWEPNGQLVSRFAPPAAPGDNYYSDSVSVAPDGQLFLSNPNGHSMETRFDANVWNADGSLLRTIPNFGANYESPGSWYDGRVTWVDSDRVALPTRDGVEIWDLRAGARQSTLAQSSDFPHLRAVAASPDGEFLLCLEQRNRKGIFQGRGVLFETKNWRRYRNYDNCVPLAWSVDSSRFAARVQNESGAGDGTLVFSTQSATPMQKSPLNSSDFNGQIAFSPDLQLAAKRDGNYSATHSQIWRVASGKLALSLYLFGEPNPGHNASPPPNAARFWLALTPGGFYDGSPNIERWLRWRQGNTLLPLGALKNERRRPDAVRAALLAG